MKRNLKIKAVVIVAPIVSCIYGVIGIPKSWNDIADSVSRNIRLGLDLKGRVQLVVQVQMQEAFGAIADSAIEQIKSDLRKNNIQISDDAITRTEPKTVEQADKVEVVIKGIPPTQAPDFRRIATGPAYSSQWNLTPVNPPSDYKMTITPSAALEIRRNTMDATVKTIDRKINGLGLAETSVQPTGRDPNDAELLVQLPGVTNPSHVEEVLKTKGILEWDQVGEGPFSSPDEALSKHGGVRPLNTKIVPEAPRGGGRRFWMVSSIPVVRGSDIMSAHASIGEARGWETDFVLSHAAASEFEAYTSANIGKQAAIVGDGQAISVPTIQGAISDRGRITGSATQQEASDLALNLDAPLLAGLVQIERRQVGASLGSDSIREGMRAGIVGLIAAVLVLLVY